MSEYLAKLKQKLGKAEAESERKADPFVGFVGSVGRHVFHRVYQPMVVSKSKITNTIGTDKTPKRVPFTSRIGNPINVANATAEVENAAPEVEAKVEPASAAMVKVDEYYAALAAFKLKRPYGVTRFRHDQACWVAEMFLNEWINLAAELGWTVDDVFDMPRAGKSGLVYWLGTDVVTALGPDQAGTESNRVFDRTTRGDWINPC